MALPSEKLNPNIPGMLIAVILFGGLAIYGTIALSAQDWLWFMPGFSEPPSRIIVYHEGKRTEYILGEPGFEVLAEGVRASLNQGVARQSGIGLSEGSLQDAYNQYVSVEAFFDHPAKIHTWFNTDSPRQMLFLISGRHSDLNIVFLGGAQGTYLSGAPALNTVAPLVNALRTLGYQF